MGSIANDWKHLLTTETSQKSLSLLNNKVTSKVKDFQKLSKKEIYFTLLSNSAKYNKLFKFISWPNILEEHHILSPDIWDKTFADWLLKFPSTQNGQHTKYCVPHMQRKKIVSTVF